MRIDVVGRNLEVTDAIREHAEAKAAKLPRYFDGVQQITLRLSRQDHQHTGAFDVELVVDVQKHADFVAHATGEDLYAAIDQAVQKSTRQLTDFKEKLKLGKR
ncbi:MAG: ribosome-associated translation inhibitor RaiA [Phycisphaerales bacterium]